METTETGVTELEEPSMTDTLVEEGTVEVPEQVDEGVVTFGFLETSLDEVPQLVCMPEGEYTLELVSGRQKISKKGDPMIEWQMGFAHYPEGKRFFEYTMLPKPDDEEYDKLRKFSDLMNIVNGFGVPKEGNQVFLRDVHGGLYCDALVGYETDAQYGESNRLVKLVTGH